MTGQQKAAPFLGLARVRASRPPHRSRLAAPPNGGCGWVTVALRSAVVETLVVVLAVFGVVLFERLARTWWASPPAVRWPPSDEERAVAKMRDAAFIIALRAWLLRAHAEREVEGAERVDAPVTRRGSRTRGWRARRAR